MRCAGPISWCSRSSPAHSNAWPRRSPSRSAHGIFFPVGDTTGAPGLVRGLRAATIYAGFAQAIDAICPQAWIINYTNPMADLHAAR